MRVLLTLCLILVLNFIVSCQSQSPADATPNNGNNTENTPGISPTPVGTAEPTATPTPLPEKPVAFKKFLIIVLENTDASKALKDPYLKSLTKRGAYLNNFYAIKHPSQPNYIAMTSGDTNGVIGDGEYNLDVQNIADLLEAKGKTWTAYAEDYPGNCFLGDSGRYCRKHMPFISYTNISKNTKRCANIKDAKELWKDFDDGNLSDYIYYTPDMDDDGHDTDVTYASQWLQKTFDSYFNNPKFMKDRLVVVTFDEANLIGANKIYTLLLGDGVIAGKSSDKKYDFYSLMATLEKVMGLDHIAPLKQDSKAILIDDVWNVKL